MMAAASSDYLREEPWIDLVELQPDEQGRLRQVVVERLDSRLAILLPAHEPRRDGPWHRECFACGLNAAREHVDFCVWRAFMRELERCYATWFAASDRGGAGHE